MSEGMPRLCVATGCRKTPSYGEPGTFSRLYCAEHKRDGTVNLAAPRCIAPGCDTISSRGPPGKRPAYCIAHQPAGMASYVSCTAPGCGVTASYGAPGDARRRFCAAHKTPGMVCLYKRRRKSRAQAPPGEARQEKRPNTADEA